MLKLEFTVKFKKDYKRAKKQGKDMGKLHEALVLLGNQDTLPENMRDHLLSVYL